MESTINQLIDRLYDNILQNDFIDIAYEVTNELMKLTNASEAIESIICLIESNPNIDFGNPGPLVHFLEKFGDDDYDVKLIESIKRNPTTHTLFMLNRIINSAGDDKKKTYLSLFDLVINSSNISDELKKVVQDFKCYHFNEKIENDGLLRSIDIVLVKPLDIKKDIINIKNVLGLELSMSALLNGSKNLPFVLVRNIIMYP